VFSFNVLPDVASANVIKVYFAEIVHSWAKELISPTIALCDDCARISLAGTLDS
jgi:large-conductance mechanosensitive channel